MRYQSDGFVLVATLWVLAAMTLFVAYFSTVVAESQAQAITIRQQLQSNLDQQATIATLLYLSSTRPMNYAGLTTEQYSRPQNINPLTGQAPFVPNGNEIRLDGRGYHGVGQVIFRLQDAGSLISLRGENFRRLERLLEDLGVERQKRQKLIANLKDYSDRDNLVNLNGAELREYDDKGLIRPLNRFLVSPMQLLNVIDWNNELNEKQLSALMHEVSVYPGSRQNFNTMTKKGMQTLGLEGIDEASISKILENQKDKHFGNLSEVNHLTGTLIPADPMSVQLFPSKFLRLTIVQEGQRQVQWVGITLTPSSRFAPWEIDYSLKREVSFNTTNAANNIENSGSALFR